MNPSPSCWHDGASFHGAAALRDCVASRVAWDQARIDHDVWLAQLLAHVAIGLLAAAVLLAVLYMFVTTDRQPA